VVSGEAEMPEPFAGRTSAGGREDVLVFLNGGIGNLIMVVPILGALHRALPAVQCHLPENELLGQEWLRSHLPFADLASDSYPPLWRRCLPGDVPALLSFTANHDVSTLVNFRKEWIQHDGNYLAFRNLAHESGIATCDLHQLPDEVQCRPLAEQMIFLLRESAIALPEPDWLWLRGMRAKRPGRIGCFVGASVAVKRWRPANWIEVIAGLRGHVSEVQVASGPGTRERAIATAVADGTAADLVYLTSVHSLVTWIGSLDILVSNDTVTTHVAAAMGCPVAGLYLATDGAIWRPKALPGSFMAFQSSIAMSCRAMKPDGTCRQFYRGCPAPCHLGVKPDQVIEAVIGMIDR
jgi:ADP-heptose:LPS heptosyltransferase